MKLWWNERYPEALYTVIENTIFVLSPENVGLAMFINGSSEMYWSETIWTVSEMDRKGFEYIGSL